MATDFSPEILDQLLAGGSRAGPANSDSSLSGFSA
ncbi:hypothetical protein ACVIVD_006783 [Bradyrhizobium liaoningense]